MQDSIYIYIKSDESWQIECIMECGTCVRLSRQALIELNNDEGSQSAHWVLDTSFGNSLSMLDNMYT